MLYEKEVIEYRKKIRTRIKEMYAEIKWYIPSNIIWSIFHFPKLCRFAYIGMEMAVFYNLNYDELENYRKTHRKK